MAKQGLEAILTKKGKECSMDPPRDMATWNNILRQLGTTYVGGPLEALKEYISNAADAGARNITITLERSRRGHSTITISDEGQGMHLPPNEEAFIGRSPSEYEGIDILADSILRLPKEIGNSARRFDPSSQGEKAIGALAWQTLGDSVAFISKKKGHRAVAWACDYRKKGRDHDFKSRVLKEEDQPGLADYVGDHGTTAVFSKVSKEVMRQLHPRTIQKDFGSRFRDLLREMGIRITVKEKGSTYPVEPEEYRGKRLIKEAVETKYGPISFEVYINPNRRDGEVRVKQGIQTLVQNLASKKSYLRSDAWGSGYLTGQIKADWLTPGAGRQDMENDDKAHIFFEALRKYNKRVEEAIKKYQKANDPGQRRNLYNAMSKAIAAMFRENPHWEDLITGYRITTRGAKVAGQPGEGYAPPIPEPPGKGTGDTERRPPTDEEKPQRSRREPGKPVDQTKRGTTTAKKSAALRFADTDELLPDEMSKYEEDNGLILFNNQHSEYMRVMGDPQRKKMYLAGLVGKELLSKVFHNPRKLADNVIAFQQAFMEYFPLS